jgi:hypothetical protein
MFNVRLYFVVVGASSLLAFTSLVSGASNDTTLADSLEKSLPAFIASQNYRSASTAAFRLASARNRLGDTAAACAALSQSLAYYRQALAKETGVFEPASSSINDDSDGMAEVRAQFGCKRS